MQANETHISLETAKLLKDCGVYSEYIFVKSDDTYVTPQTIKTDRLCFLEIETNLEYYPAFTWQDILWEHAEEFFEARGYELETILLYILSLLRQGKHEEADIYFREHCVLIKYNFFLWRIYENT